MSTEITTTGSKKIKTLKKQFNEKFPFLRLGLFPSSSKADVANGKTITNLDADKTLSAVREKVGDGDISIHGRKLVKNLEAEFEEVFGLYAQVCWTDGNGKRFYTIGSDQDKSLTALNREKEAEGAEKGAWK